MSWPKTVFLNTFDGIYRTDNFSPTAAADWVDISGNLLDPPYDNILDYYGLMFLDPFAPLKRQFYLDATGYLFVREDDGDWVERWNCADTFNLLGWELPETESHQWYYHGSFCVDPLIAGRIYLYFHAHFWGYELHPYEHFVLRSDDYGVSFTPVLIENQAGLIREAAGIIVSHGNEVALCLNFSDEVTGDGYKRIYRSLDGGLTWDHVSIASEETSYNTGLAMDPRGGRVYFQYMSDNDGVSNLYRCDLATLAITRLPGGERLGDFYDCTDDIPVRSGVGLIFDPANPDHQYMYSSCDDAGISRSSIARLFETFDGWQTRRELPPVGKEGDQHIIGMETNLLPAGSGVFWVNSGRNGLYAYENGRPDLAVDITGGLGTGEVCFPLSLQIPPTRGGAVHTYGVAMLNVAEDADRGIPIPGDRSAWDAAGHPEKHANDVDTLSGLHHTLGTGATQAAAGNHTHDDRYSPLGHDHTAGDIDSTGASDGQVLTADGLGGAAWKTPAGGSVAASAVTVDASGFAGNLSAADTTVQAALQTIDAMTVSGGDLVNPMTTAGDIIIGASAGSPARLGIGTEGQVLTVVGGVPAWADAPRTGGEAFATIDPEIQQAFSETFSDSGVPTS